MIITIYAGTITAKGGDGNGGAGIGGGYIGGSGAIMIFGETVTGTGGSQGAGIGSGPAGNLATSPSLAVRLSQTAEAGVRASAQQ